MRRSIWEGWNELDNIIVLPYTFNRSMNNNYNIDSYVVKAKSAPGHCGGHDKAGRFPERFVSYEC